MPEKYFAAPTLSEAWSEVVEKEKLLFEQIFLGLRKISGTEVNLALLELDARSSLKVLELFAELSADGFLEVTSPGDTCGAPETSHCIKLSEKGLLVADSVVAEFSKLLV